MNISIHRVKKITQFDKPIVRDDGTVFFIKSFRVEDKDDTWYEITLVSDDKENLEIK